MALARIQVRRGTSAQWASSNPILAAGEPGFDTTLKQLRIGDGSTPWSGLPAATPDAATISQILATAAAVEGAVTPTDAVMAAAVGTPGTATEQALSTAMVAGRDLLQPEAVRDGSADDRAALSSASSAAQTAGIGLVLRKGVHRVASNLTINVPVHFQSGAVIKPDSGVTVTLAAGFTSEGLRQVFDHSAGGVVAPRGVDAYHPAHWGPVNTANDSPAWKAALAAAAVSGVGLFRVPTGISRIWDIDVTAVTLVADSRDSSVLPVTSLAAPGTPSAGTGYMVKLATSASISGGRWGSDNINGITLIYYTGHRGYVKDAYIFPIGTDTIGIFCEPPEAGSITPRIINTIIQGNSADPKGIGVLAKSADGSMTDVVVAYLTTGVRIERASWVLQNYHVWDCTLYGLDLYFAVYTRLLASYIENCGSWGVYMDRSSRTTIASTRFWHNGKSVAGTGGLRLRSEGTRYTDDCNVYDTIFDDNVGTAVSVDRSRRNRFDITIASTEVEAGNAPLGTAGIVLANNAFGNHVKVSGSVDASLGGDTPNPLLGALVTNNAGSQNTIQFYRKVARAAAAVTLGPTTSRPDLVTIPVGSGHKLRIEATVVVNGAAANDLAIQLRTNVAPLAGGWYAVDSQPTIASTPGAEGYRPPLALTLSNVSGSNVANVGLLGSAQVVKLTGYVEMDSALGQVVLNAGVVTNDGATATVQFAELIVERVG